MRGSIPTPGSKTRRYGGNTACVEVRSEKALLVFDAGTGIRELGVELMRNPPPQGISVHLFLSHPHWDHIQGFPFFGPAYVQNTTITVYCPEGDPKNYQLLSGQMSNAYFPVRFAELKAKITQESFTGDAVEAGDFVVRHFNQRHPGGSVGFRIEHEGASVVYATDSEIDLQLADQKLPFQQPQKLRGVPKDLVTAMRDANLLVADAQYTDPEYADPHGVGPPARLDGGGPGGSRPGGPARAHPPRPDALRSRHRREGHLVRRARDRPPLERRGVRRARGRGDEGRQARHSRHPLRGGRRGSEEE